MRQKPAKKELMPKSAPVFKFGRRNIRLKSLPAYTLACNDNRYLYLLTLALDARAEAGAYKQWSPHLSEFSTTQPSCALICVILSSSAR